MVTDEDAEKAAAFIFHNAAKHGEAKGMRIQLQEFRKSKKAILMAEYRPAQNSRDTDKVRESYAYSHNDYLEVLAALEMAVAIEEEISWKMRACESKIAIWRTQSANNRRIDSAHT